MDSTPFLCQISALLGRGLALLMSQQTPLMTKAIARVSLAMSTRSQVRLSQAVEHCHAVAHLKCAIDSAALVYLGCCHTYLCYDRDVASMNGKVIVLGTRISPPRIFFGEVFRTLSVDHKSQLVPRI